MNSLGMEESPAWSPDGREIVYVGSSECARDTSCFGFLVMIDVATGSAGRSPERWDTGRAGHPTAS